MSDKVFIDTNILLYAYDRDAGAKHEVARELVQHCWEDASGVISIQVLSEFFVRATRAGDSFVSLEEAESIVQNLSHTWPVLIPRCACRRRWRLRWSSSYHFSTN